jgi:CHAD domain-containing protein
VSDPRNGSARLRRAFRREQRILARHLARLPGCDPVDVHQSRVACRRLRSYLKVFKPFFEDEAALGYRRMLGAIAELGSELRALDVIAALPEMSREPFAANLRQARVDAARALRRRLSTTANRAQLATAGGTTLGALGLLSGVPASAVLRRVRRSWRHANEFVSSPPRAEEALHKLRIRLKNFRYALEIVADLEVDTANALDRRLREVQQILGDRRDAAAALKWLKACAVPTRDARVAVESLVLHGSHLDRQLGPSLQDLAAAGQRWDRAISRRLDRDRAARS